MNRATPRALGRALHRHGKSTMHRIAIFGVGCLCCISDLTSAQTQNCFPLHVGNEWVYRDSVPTISETANEGHVSVTGRVTIEQTTYALVKEGRRVDTLRSMPEGMLYRYESGGEFPYLYFDLAVGESATDSVLMYGTWCKQRITRWDVDSLRNGCIEADSTLQALYCDILPATGHGEFCVFAPGVGLVKRITPAGAHAVYRTLVFARVNGEVVVDCRARVHAGRSPADEAIQSRFDTVVPDLRQTSDWLSGGTKRLNCYSLHGRRQVIAFEPANRLWIAVSGNRPARTGLILRQKPVFGH